MNQLPEDQSANRKRTLLTSLLLSAPAPLVTGYAVLTSQSTTQLADFFRRTAELTAIFVSWWVYRQLHRTETVTETRQVRLEKAATLTTAGAMTCSGIVLLVVVFLRLSAFQPGGNVITGLIIAVLGVLTNGWFWHRYDSFLREKYNAVIASQRQLYRTKTVVDLCVTTALTTVAIAPSFPATRYVDLVGSIIVACYLLVSGLGMLRTRFGGLRKLFHHLRGYFAHFSHRAPSDCTRIPKP